MCPRPLRVTVTPTLKIFLSSTSDDLWPHRDKVRERMEKLGQATIHMGAFGARPTDPMTTCRRNVEACDALVVIVGHRYGWVPSVDEGGDGEKSITWWK